MYLFLFGSVCSFYFLYFTFKWKSYCIYLSISRYSQDPSMLHSQDPSMLPQMARFHSFLWLNAYPTAYRKCSFFIHSSADGLLGRFHALALVNNPVTNMGVHISLWVSVFVSLDIFPGVGLLDPVVLFLIFERYLHVFHNSCTSFYIPTNRVQRFPFLHIPINACYFLPFW